MGPTISYPVEIIHKKYTGQFSWVNCDSIGVVVEHSLQVSVQLHSLITLSASATNNKTENSIKILMPSGGNSLDVYNGLRWVNF